MRKKHLLVKGFPVILFIVTLLQLYVVYGSINIVSCLFSAILIGLISYYEHSAGFKTGHTLGYKKGHLKGLTSGLISGDRRK